MTDQDLLYNTCVILPYRYSAPDRKKALMFVLKWMSVHLPEPEVIVVEQDSSSQIDFELPSGCRHIFLKNNGLFNKCWSFNAGVAQTSREFLFFHDSDMFLSREDYIKSIRNLMVFEAVNPNAKEYRNVSIRDMESLTFDTLSNRFIRPFAGGLFVIRKASLYEIGGWNEEFEGWGSEDNEISFRIQNLIPNIQIDCQIYHIDHGRGARDWMQQEAVDQNRRYLTEILTFSGPSLSNYVMRLKSTGRGNPLKFEKKSPELPTPVNRFVLAVTVYNQLKALKQLLHGWNQTRSRKVEWTLVIADDGSDDGTIQYLDNFSIEGVDIQFIRNKLNGTAAQLNTILDYLETSTFDVCFVCHPDISFLQSGWDEAYHAVILRTGYDLLCFHDKQWKQDDNEPRPVVAGQLVSHCKPESIQGFFFTITPAMMLAVGFFDAGNLGVFGMERIDYILRGCRAGFNSLLTPFDISGSNDYLKITQQYSPHHAQNYLMPMPGDFTILRHAMDIIFKSRIFIPRNQIINLRDKSAVEARLIQELRNERQKETIGHGKVKNVEINARHRMRFKQNAVSSAFKKTCYSSADIKNFKTTGFKSLVVQTMKRMHNLMINWNCRFAIHFMDQFANYMLRAGLFIKNIDK